MRTLFRIRDQEEIRARIHTIQPQSARRWGRMSAHQMVCHLSDAYRLYMGAIPAAPAGFPYPSKVLKLCSLWVPIRWPRNFKTVPEVDQEAGGTSPVEFERDVHELKNLFDRFVHSPREFSWPSQHPLLGSMSERDWMRLGYLHADHHLRQFGL